MLPQLTLPALFHGITKFCGDMFERYLKKIGKLLRVHIYQVRKLRVRTLHLYGDTDSSSSF